MENGSVPTTTSRSGTPNGCTASFPLSVLVTEGSEEEFGSEDLAEDSSGTNSSELLSDKSRGRCRSVRLVLFVFSARRA